MEDWQVRVVDEKAFLGSLIDKLSYALRNSSVFKISPSQMELMRKQRTAMVTYYSILDERIGEF